MTDPDIASPYWDLVEATQESPPDRETMIAELGRRHPAAVDDVDAILATEPFGYLIEKSGINNGYYFVSLAEYAHVEERFRHIYLPVFAGSYPDRKA